MRPHSVCAQGGINAVLDAKGERDSIDQHIHDTLKGGSWLANQPPVKSLCEAAPSLIRTFERMGVTFSRTPEGLLDQRLFGGVKHRRTCFAGASTGQQLMHGVDQQVRWLEAEGRVQTLEWWEFPEKGVRALKGVKMRDEWIGCDPKTAAGSVPISALIGRDFLGGPPVTFRVSEMALVARSHMQALGGKALGVSYVTLGERSKIGVTI